MTHSTHDLGCGARESKKCDCIQGRDRRTKAKAIKFFKRHKGKVPIIKGKIEGFDWLDRRLGREKKGETR
jgi:hypothetical protein